MIMGGGGSLIYDTQGVDTYTLGAGDDVIKFSLNDLGDLDVVNNFDATADALDLSDLLDVQSLTDQTLGDYLQMGGKDGQTLQVDLDGAGSNWQDVVTMDTTINLLEMLSNNQIIV